MLALSRSSPAVYPIPDETVLCMFLDGCETWVAVTNGSGTSVTITGREYLPNDDKLQFDDTSTFATPRSECTVGRALGSQETCYLAVSAKEHFD
jgi:hypothetical protein